VFISKIKPCMSKYKRFLSWNRERLIKSAIIYLILTYLTWITVVILELIHAPKLWPCGKSAFIRAKPSGLGRFLLTQNNSADRTVFEPATCLLSICLINFRW